MQVSISTSPVYRLPPTQRIDAWLRSELISKFPHQDEEVPVCSQLLWATPDTGHDDASRGTSGAIPSPTKQLLGVGGHLELPVP